MNLSTKTVKGSSLSFQCVDNIHGGDGLSLGVLGVGDCITDHVLEENFENTTSFFVDQTRDTFDTTATSETANGGLCDSLDVVTQDFTMTLSASFSKTFASFTTT